MFLLWLWRFQLKFWGTWTPHQYFRRSSGKWKIKLWISHNIWLHLNEGMLSYCPPEIQWKVERGTWIINFGGQRRRVEWIINEEEVESGSNGLQGEKCFWTVTLLIHLTKSWTLIELRRSCLNGVVPVGNLGVWWILVSVVGSDKTLKIAILLLVGKS